MTALTITQPDDWHVHFRDGATLSATVAATARCFARAIVMPNLTPPVTSTALARDYRARIFAALPRGHAFEPLMTLYLHDAMRTDEVRRAKESGDIHAVKLYPAGATTHSEAGVTAVSKVYPVLAALEEHDLPLLVHGEVVDDTVDVFDREAVFIERVLEPLVRRFSALRIVFEHVTTRDAVAFVRDAPSTVAATITPHHLTLNRNALFRGGLRPHQYCLPVLKREVHRKALVGAATGGEAKFFLGTDSAPHAKHDKESACGCAGIYSAPAALELYAEVFDQAGALDKLEGFASVHGPAFYRLPRNESQVCLHKEPLRVPLELELGTDTVVPFRAGDTLAWRVL